MTVLQVGEVSARLRVEAGYDLRVPRVALLLCLTGCSQLLGFEEPIVPDDPGFQEIRFALTRLHLENGTEAEVLTIDDPPSIEGVVARLADGTSVEVSLAPDDTISFTVPTGERYRVSFPSGDRTVEIQATHVRPAAQEVVFGRADAELATVRTDVVVTELPGPGLYSMLSTGVWGFSTPVQSALGDNLVVDWSQARGFDGRIASLVSAEQRDLIHVARFTSAPVNETPTQVLTELQTTSIDMVPGGTTVVQGTFNTLELSSGSFMIDAASLDTTISSSEVIEETAQGLWAIAIRATPTALRPEIGHTLALTTSQDFRPHELSIGYPHAAFPHAVHGIAFANRAQPFELPDVVTDVNASILKVFPIDQRDLYDIESLPAVEMPRRVELDGLALIGQTLHEVAVDPDQPARVTWAAVSGADVYLVELVKFGTQPIRSFLTTDTFVTIDPDLLEDGGIYSLHLVSLGGYADAAAGDFVTRTLPFAQTVHQSAFFIVR
jgi:hypothetical protein